VPGTKATADKYFAALTRRDVEAMAALWTADGTEHIAGQVDAVGPDGVREYFTDLFGAFPDLTVTVQSTTVQADRGSTCCGSRTA
jgi:ketosteroid isomerase-like protein